MLNMSFVEHVKMSSQSRFRFRCHKDISCFTKCCNNIDIMLTPYDIIVMKKRLNIDSEEFLERYTYTEIDEGSMLPFVFLKMLDTEKKECPFVTPQGCTIYDDRPVNCRYYPVGQGMLKKAIEKGVKDEEFFFLVKEPHCKGFEENVEWSIDEWRKDQNIIRYDELNRGWKEILLTNKSLKKLMDAKKQAAFYMACYNIDVFKKFLFSSRFFEVFALDEKIKRELQDNNESLLIFGFRYIKYIFLIEETLKLRNPDSVTMK